MFLWAELLWPERFVFCGQRFDLSLLNNKLHRFQVKKKSQSLCRNISVTLCKATLLVVWAWGGRDLWPLLMNSPPEPLVSLCPVWKAIIIALRACLCPPQREREKENKCLKDAWSNSLREKALARQRLFLPTMPWVSSDLWAALLLFLPGEVKWILTDLSRWDGVESGLRGRSDKKKTLAEETPPFRTDAQRRGLCLCQSKWGKRGL